MTSRQSRPRHILRLHNWVADAIHREDAKALVSAGSWSSLASTWVAGDDPVHKVGSGYLDIVDLMLTFLGGLQPLL